MQPHSENDSFQLSKIVGQASGSVCHKRPLMELQPMTLHPDDQSAQTQNVSSEVTIICLQPPTGGYRREARITQSVTSTHPPEQARSTSGAGKLCPRAAITVGAKNPA